MKSFNELSRSKKILTVVAGLLAGGIFLFDGQEDDFVTQGGGYPTSENSTYTVNNSAETSAINQTSNNQPMNSQGSVELYDQGYQMVMGTYTLPDGWKLNQDIAVDPNTNKSIRYYVEMIGPRGELIRSLGSGQYGAMTGLSFDQCWQQIVMGNLQRDFGQVSVGSFQADPVSRQNLMKFKVFQRLISKGVNVQCMQAPFTAQYNGRAYKGMVNITRTEGMGGGSVSAGFAIAPAEGFTQLVETQQRITQSYTVNPAYEQRLEGVQAGVQNRIQTESNARMAASAAAHQQRMAQNQAAFNASQQNIAEMNQIRDANHNSYMNGLRNDNSSAWSNGNSYTGHDAYIDGIHGRTTLENPDTGFDTQMDGHYKYYYTDGLGNYHGTDDPNFNPASMQGSWYQIDPRSPNY